MTPGHRPSPAPEVGIDSGRLRGAERHGILEFLGVPYAAPLDGAARFAPPAPAPGWRAVRDAAAPGPAVAQIGTGGHIGRDALSSRPQGPDGLNLNIRTSSLEDPKPVLVWFHGGGLFAGSNAEPQLSTRAFAADGVVEVIANYRLGIQGYLALGGDSANRGLLDQIAVLAWVQRNIRSFGGDPAQVTIGGHSAGGFACAELLASPAARGLFHRVILGSGASSARHTLPTADAIRALTFERLGITRNRDLEGLSDQQILAAQQSLIEECYTLMPPHFGQASVLGLPFEHTIDGATVVGDVPRALAAGVASQVPVLVMTTSGESRAHVSGFPEEITDEQAASTYEGMVRPLGVDGRTVVRAYRKFLPRLSTKGLMAALNADLRFTLDSVRLAAAQAPHAPTFRLLLGEFDDAFGGLTPHGGVQGHVWRAPDGHPVPELKPQHHPFNPATAAFVHSAVVSFVRTGAPVSALGEARSETGETFSWPTVSSLAGDEVLWRGPDRHQVIGEPSADRLAWWGDRLDRSADAAANALLD
jgi:para-nitrobenzyl esterase